MHACNRVTVGLKVTNLIFGLLLFWEMRRRVKNDYKEKNNTIRSLLIGQLENKFDLYYLQ
jgi:hypothetical protein